MTALRLPDLWPPGGNRTSGDAETEILRQAIRLFGRRGYGGTSLRTIAAEARVTAPLIGYHFGRKEGLFQACVQVVMESSTASLRLPSGDDLSLEDGVRHFATEHVRFASAYPEALRFILTVAYGPEENQPAVDLAACWRDVVFELVQRFERALADGEFVARAGATAPRLAHHLLNVVHLEVMGAYEKERFLGEAEDLAAVLDAGDLDLVEDLVAQFFHGAGQITVGKPEEPRS